MAILALEEEERVKELYYQRTELLRRPGVDGISDFLRELAVEPAGDLLQRARARAAETGWIRLVDAIALVSEHKARFLQQRGAAAAEQYQLENAFTALSAAQTTGKAAKTRPLPANPVNLADCTVSRNVLRKTLQRQYSVTFPFDGASGLPEKDSSSGTQSPRSSDDGSARSGASPCGQPEDTRYKLEDLHAKLYPPAEREAFQQFRQLGARADYTGDFSIPTRNIGIARAFGKEMVSEFANERKISRFTFNDFLDLSAIAAEREAQARAAMEEARNAALYKLLSTDRKPPQKMHSFKNPSHLFASKDSASTSESSRLTDSLLNANERTKPSTTADTGKANAKGKTKGTRPPTQRKAAVPVVMRSSLKEGADGTIEDIGTPGEGGSPASWKRRVIKPYGCDPGTPMHLHAFPPVVGPVTLNAPAPTATLVQVARHLRTHLAAHEPAAARSIRHQSFAFPANHLAWRQGTEHEPQRGLTGWRTLSVARTGTNDRIQNGWSVGPAPEDHASMYRRAPIPPQSSHPARAAAAQHPVRSSRSPDPSHTSTPGPSSARNAAARRDSRQPDDSRSPQLLPSPHAAAPPPPQSFASPGASAPAPHRARGRRKAAGGPRNKIAPAQLLLCALPNSPAHRSPEASPGLTPVEDGAVPEREQLSLCSLRTPTEASPLFIAAKASAGNGAPHRAGGREKAPDKLVSPGPDNVDPSSRPRTEPARGHLSLPLFRERATQLSPAEASPAGNKASDKLVSPRPDNEDPAPGGGGGGGGRYVLRAPGNDELAAGFSAFLVTPASGAGRRGAAQNAASGGHCLGPAMSGPLGTGTRCAAAREGVVGISASQAPDERDDEEQSDPAAGEIEDFARGPTAERFGARVCELLEGLARRNCGALERRKELLTWIADPCVAVAAKVCLAAAGVRRACVAVQCWVRRIAARRLFEASQRGVALALLQAQVDEAAATLQQWAGKVIRRPTLRTLAKDGYRARRQAEVTSRLQKGLRGLWIRGRAGPADDGCGPQGGAGHRRDAPHAGSENGARFKLAPLRRARDAEQATDHAAVVIQVFGRCLLSRIHSTRQSLDSSLLTKSLDDSLLTIDS
ncbi:hypothetical protein DIPPA_10249 [Diplonema papillatum]|nr:hypothetical protein DIPPA_10249 [Diplonema papillatum]